MTKAMTKSKSKQVKNTKSWIASKATQNTHKWSKPKIKNKIKNNKPTTNNKTNQWKNNITKNQKSWVSPKWTQMPIIKIGEIKWPKVNTKQTKKSILPKKVKSKKRRIPKSNYQKVFEAYLEEREAKYQLIKAKVRRLEAQLDMEYDIKNKRQDILQNIEKLRKYSNNMLREKVQYLKTIKQIDYAHEEIRVDIKKNVEKIMWKLKKSFWKLIEKI